MKRFRRIPGIFLSTLLLGLLVYTLGWSHLFSLKKIVIHGTTAQANISQTLANVKPSITIGKPLARIDVQSINRALSKSEWITRAEVGRSWLHGALTVYIQERRPVASYIDEAGVVRYFDFKGHDFASPLHYQEIPSIQLQSKDLSSKVAISRFLAILPSDLLSSVSSFSVLNADEIDTTLITPTGTKVLIKWGSASDISLKVTVYRKLLSLKENTHAKYFDLHDPLLPISK